MSEEAEAVKLEDGGRPSEEIIKLIADPFCGCYDKCKCGGQDKALAFRKEVLRLQAVIAELRTQRSRLEAVIESAANHEMSSHSATEALKDRDECIRALRLDLEAERNLVENLRPMEARALEADATINQLTSEIQDHMAECQMTDEDGQGSWP